MTDKERMGEVIKILGDYYPDAACALGYEGDPWRLLVMGRLSAQCTDKRVNEVSQELFSSFPTAEAMAEGDISRIESIIKPCGLYRMKADNIKAASRMLVDEYGGVLPNDIDELTRLPGVGRKIANMLVGDIYGGSCIVADTHMMRVSGRLGFYEEGLRDANKVERILRGIVPEGAGSDLCHRVVILGREICEARRPRCEECPLKGVCKHYERVGEDGKEKN